MNPRSLELIDALRDPFAKADGSTARGIADEYGVEIYHLRHLAWAIEYCQFTGHVVLEVGGSLPKDLIAKYTDASNWISLEYLPYYQDLAFEFTGNVLDLSECTNPNSLPFGQIVSGAVENIPESWYRQFDSIFSVACFEHINRLPLALRSMAKALRCDRRTQSDQTFGRLYSGFAPIWTSATGYHLSIHDLPVKDRIPAEGEVFFDYMHLTHSPIELYEYLEKLIGEENAQTAVYLIYHSNHINRLYLEDYFHATRLCELLKGTIAPYARRVVSDAQRGRISARCPKAKHVEFDGLVFRLEVVC